MIVEGVQKRQAVGHRLECHSIHWLRPKKVWDGLHDLAALTCCKGISDRFEIEDYDQTAEGETTFAIAVDELRTFCLSAATGKPGASFRENHAIRLRLSPL